MQTPIFSSITGKLVAITTGIIAAGSTLFTTETMKMESSQNTSASGTFVAVAVVGAIVVAGETIIGYFTAAHEE
jgi:biotin carboxyl carrier protein